MAPEHLERHDPDGAVDEWETLTQRLDFLRVAVLRKVHGLGDEQACARPVPASELTVAGIVKHLTGVERFWFSIDFAGADLPWPWPEDDPHGCFAIGPADTLERLAADYLAECERSRSSISGHPLDAMAKGEGMTFNLRFALVHMIEETARHCGHLDLLRESIDGMTGQ